MLNLIFIFLLSVLFSCENNEDLKKNNDIINSLKAEIAKLQDQLDYIAVFTETSDKDLKLDEKDNLYKIIKSLYLNIYALENKIGKYYIEDPKENKSNIDNYESKLENLKANFEKIKNNPDLVVYHEKFVDSIFKEVEYLSWLHGWMKVEVSKPITNYDLILLSNQRLDYSIYLSLNQIYDLIFLLDQKIDYSIEEKNVEMIAEEIVARLYLDFNQCFTDINMWLNFLNPKRVATYNLTSYVEEDPEKTAGERNGINRVLWLLDCYTSRISKDKPIIMIGDIELVNHLRQNNLLSANKELSEVVFDYRDLYYWIYYYNTDNIGQYFPSVENLIEDNKTYEDQDLLFSFYNLEKDNLMQYHRAVEHLKPREHWPRRYFRFTRIKSMKSILEYREKKEKEWIKKDLKWYLDNLTHLDMFPVESGEIDIAFNPLFARDYINMDICEHDSSDCEKKVEDYCNSINANDIEEYCKPNILEIFKNTKQKKINIPKKIHISSHQITRGFYKRVMGVRSRIYSWENTKEFTELNNLPLSPIFHKPEKIYNSRSGKGIVYPYKKKKVPNDDYPATNISKKDLELFFLRLNKCKIHYDGSIRMELKKTGVSVSHEDAYIHFYKNRLKYCKEYKKSKGLIYFRLPTENEMSYIAKMYDRAYEFDGDIIPRSVHHYFDQGFFYKKIKHENIFSGYIDHKGPELVSAKHPEYQTTQKIYHISGNAYDIVTTKSGDLLLKGCSVISHINECLPNSSKKYKRSYYSGFRVVAELP